MTSNQDLWETVKTNESILLQAIEVLREEGNSYFKSKKYEEAKDSYTQGILGLSQLIENKNPKQKQNQSKLDADIKDFYSKMQKLYSNRSACNLKLQKHSEAMNDADICIELDPSWTKAYYRKACVLYETKENISDCVQLLNRVLREDKNNKDCLRMLNEITNSSSSSPSLVATTTSTSSMSTTSLHTKSTISGQNLRSKVTLPTSLYYPSQSWFTKTPIGEGLQHHLQEYSMLYRMSNDCINTLCDNDLLSCWLNEIICKNLLSFINSQSTQGISVSDSSEENIFMIGSLASLLPLNLYQASPLMKSSLFILEQSNLVSKVVNGNIKKNLMIFAEKKVTSNNKDIAQLDASDLDVNLKKQNEEIFLQANNKFLVSPKPIHDYHYEDYFNMLSHQNRMKGIPNEGNKEPRISKIIWSDWDFSLLGNGILKFIKQAKKDGILSPDIASNTENSSLEPTISIFPRYAKVFAFLISFDDKVQFADIIENIYEIGPSKFPYIERIYNTNVDMKAESKEDPQENSRYSFDSKYFTRVSEIVSIWDFDFTKNYSPTSTEIEFPLLVDKSAYTSISANIKNIYKTPLFLSNPPVILLDIVLYKLLRKYFKQYYK